MSNMLVYVNYKLIKTDIAFPLSFRLSLFKQNLALHQKTSSFKGDYFTIHLFIHFIKNYSFNIRF